MMWGLIGVVLNLSASFLWFLKWPNPYACFMFGVTLSVAVMFLVVLSSEIKDFERNRHSSGDW